MQKILVSACLLGHRCRYDGGSKPCEAVIQLSGNYELIPVCPESAGGLKIPRLPSEIVGERVISKDGRDVTENYMSGAEKTLETALKNGVHIAVMKERSPSCGTREVYDGTFSGRLVKGKGITAALLEKHGIVVLGESEIEKLL